MPSSEHTAGAADTTASAVKPRRADARRNYDLVLQAARQVFAERGAEAPLDDIARRAGVGNATMYRHFPTRRDLVLAVYSDEVTQLCEQGTTLLEQDPPDDALFTWLRAFVAHVAAKRDLALALPDDGQRSAIFEQWHQAMHSTASALLARAQRAGAVRADLAEADLLAVANGIALTGAPGAQTERLLALIRRGATSLA